jgi:hypothetical protein
MNSSESLDLTPILNTLRAEIIRVSQEVAATEAEDALFSGGLVKSLIAVRLQILRTTRALLEQRIHSLETDAPITIVIPTTQPDELRAHALAQDIQAQEVLLQAARGEASLYTGGLVHSLKLSTIATQEQTLAMLRQYHLVAKYGLAIPAPSPGTPAAATPAAYPSEPTIPPSPVFEIVKVDARVTETNAVWSRYAWQLAIQSLAKAPLQLQAKIEFLDGQGFIIADHIEHSLILLPGSTETFAGSSLITAAIAGNVRKVSAKVTAS